MSLEHFLNSLVVVWGSCRVPSGSLVSKHVPWLQVLSSQPGWGSWASSGAQQSSALVLVQRDTGSVSACVFSPSPYYLPHSCGSWNCLVPDWGGRGCAEHGIWADPGCPWLSRDRPSAWRDKKPLLHLPLLHPVGVFSAVVAEEAPKCRNLSGTCKASNTGGSEQESHRKESLESHIRVSTHLNCIEHCCYGQLRSNFGNARPDPVPLEIGFLLLRKQCHQFWGSDTPPRIIFFISL